MTQVRQPPPTVAETCRQMSAAAAQLPRALKREYLRKRPEGAAHELRLTLLQEGCALALVMAVGVSFWCLASLIPGASLSVAVAGCVIVVVIAAGTCTYFFVHVWREMRLAKSGLICRPDGHARPFCDALMTVVAVLVVAGTPFVLATAFADASSLAAADPQITEQGRFHLAANLFLWHLLDALPVLDATDTLKWKEPVTDYSGVTGTLLVAYKTLFLAPGVLVTRQAWKRMLQPSETGAQGGGVSAA